jgi:hypothetical protein
MIGDSCLHGRGYPQRLVNASKIIKHEVNCKRMTMILYFLRVSICQSRKAGTGVLSTVDGLPFFLLADALKPYISEELRMSTTPIFRLAGFFFSFRGTSVPPIAVSTTDRASARGSAGFFLGFLGMPHHARL